MGKRKEKRYSKVLKGQRANRDSPIAENMVQTENDGNVKRNLGERYSYDVLNKESLLQTNLETGRGSHRVPHQGHFLRGL